MPLPTIWSDCATEEQAVGAIIPASRLNKILGNLLKLGGTTGLIPTAALAANAVTSDKANLTVANAFLLATLPWMTDINAWYNILSLNLAAGTWVIWGYGSVDANGQGAGLVLIEIFDGAAQSGINDFSVVAGGIGSGSTSAPVTIATPATVSLRFKGSVANYSIRANKASITALRIA